MIPVKVLKNSCNSSNDKESFEQFQTTARTYYKLYYSLIKDKKGLSGSTNNSKTKMNFQKESSSTNYQIYIGSLLNENNSQKFKDEIKNWFFSLPIESRMKMATVESELICNWLYLMYAHYHISNPTCSFKMMECIFSSTQIVEDQKENREIENKAQQGQANPSFPAKAIAFSKDNIEDYSEQDLLFSNLANFFTIDTSIKSGEGEPNLRNYKFESNLMESIRIYSINSKFDSMTLSPGILLDDNLFEVYFKFFGNQDYFRCAIKPIYLQQSKLYSYMLPSWMHINQSYSLVNYILSFVEQAILIKFILNVGIGAYNPTLKKKKEKEKAIPMLHSLVDDAKMSSFFQNRRDVITYISKSFDTDPGMNIFGNVINVKEIFTTLMSDKNFCKEIRLKHQLTGESSYCFLHKKPSNQSSSVGSFENSLKSILKSKDNILFVDFLIFHTLKELWKIDCFIGQKIFDRLCDLNGEKNVMDLINEEKNSKKKQKKKSDSLGLNNNLTNPSIDPDYEYYSVYFLHYKWQNDFMSNQQVSSNIKDNKTRKSNAENNLIGGGSCELLVEDLEVNVNEIIRNTVRNELVIGIINNAVISSNKNKSPHQILVEDTKGKEEKTSLAAIKDNTQDTEKSYLGDQVNLKIEDPSDKNTFDNDLCHTNLNANTDERRNSKKAKKKKENTFFLYDTIKKKKETAKKGKCTIEQENYPNTSTNPNSASLLTNTIQTVTSELEHSNTNDYLSSSTTQLTPLSPDKNSAGHSSPKHVVSSLSNPGNMSMVSNFPQFNPWIPVDFNLTSRPIIFNSISQALPTSNLQFTHKLHNDILLYEVAVDEVLEATFEMKKYTINFIENFIAQIKLDDAFLETDIYGSYASGLMIESSDIDMKIKIIPLGKPINTLQFENIIFSLSKEFVAFGKFNSVILINSASVPLIKLVVDPIKIAEDDEIKKNIFEFTQSKCYLSYKFPVDEIEKIKVDLTFIETKNWKTKTMSSVEFAKTKVQMFPEVRPILKVIKRYLKNQKLNNCFNGGLSSFCLFLLILAYVQFRHVTQSVYYNLGQLLIEFLEFYGKHFNFRTCEVNVNSPSCYLLISSQSGLYSEYAMVSSNSMVIIDPLTYLNASKSSFKIEDIQRAFLEAFDMLIKYKTLFENEGTKEETNSNCIFHLLNAI